MAIKERITCIITIETVMCIMHCRKYHLLVTTETSICIITTKIVTHIFAAETVTCVCAAKTSHCIIATETVTCIIATERSTNMPVTKYHLKTMHKLNRRCHLPNCHEVSFAQFQHKLPPAEITTESFTYRNGVSLRFFLLQ